MTRATRLGFACACLALACCGAPRAAHPPSAATPADATAAPSAPPPSAPRSAALASVAPPSTPASTPSALSRADCVADLDKLARRVADEWAYADDKREHFGVDLPRLAAVAQESLGEQPTPGAVAEALRTFVAGMQDGHASLIVAGTPVSPSRAWPFTVADSSDGVIVMAVADGTPDVRPGDTVLAVDQEPIEARIADELPRVFASTEGARRDRALHAMRQTDAVSARFILQRPQGTLMELQLDTIPGDRFLPSLRPGCFEPTQRRIGEFGYLCVGTMCPPLKSPILRISFGTPEQQRAVLEPTIAAYREAFTDLADTRALILDLRETSGLDVAAMEVARQLLAPDAIYCQIQSRLEDGAWSPLNPQELPSVPSVPRYTHPLVVLIDEDTFGAAETLAACLRDELPGTRFVGRPTAGSCTTDLASVHLEHTGGWVHFSKTRVYSPAGALIEGRGVVPDVEVRWTRDDVLMARDPDLAAALAVLGPPER